MRMSLTKEQRHEGKNDIARKGSKKRSNGKNKRGLEAEKGRR